MCATTDAPTGPGYRYQTRPTSAFRKPCRFVSWRNTEKRDHKETAHAYQDQKDLDTTFLLCVSLEFVSMPLFIMCISQLCLSRRAILKNVQCQRTL